MRIISGKHRGFRFSPPKNTPARPTTDIAKEGLFNILNNRYYFEDIKFLDLFGGTGSLSFEFASRGCTDITNVEIDRKNVLFIKSISEQKEMGIKVIKMDVFKYIKVCNDQYDLIFAGPPYPLKTLSTIPDKVIASNILNKEGELIMEHNPNHNFEDHPNFLLKRNYGTTIFSFFCSQEKLDNPDGDDESE